MTDELINDVFNYAQSMYEDIMSRKQHIEIKILSVLQATAILTALYSAVCGVYVIDDNELLFQIKVLSIIFYCLSSIAILVLLLALDDKIKHKIFKKHSGFFRETKPPKELLEIIINSDEKMDRTEILEKLIVDYDTSIQSGKDILIEKDKFLIYGVRFFIYAIMTLIIIGIVAIIGGC